MGPLSSGQSRQRLSGASRRAFDCHAIAQLFADYNSIEYLWRATKGEATHNHYFPEFADLIASVEKTLATLAIRPDYVRSLFTFYLEQLQQTQPIQVPALPLAA